MLWQSFNPDIDTFPVAISLPVAAQVHLYIVSFPAAVSASFCFLIAFVLVRFLNE